MKIQTDLQTSYSVLQIGKYFVEQASSEHKPITNKKLQKLVYYAQAWSMVLNEKKLFNDKIEAWVHGPAVRKLYSAYKKFGFDEIPASGNSSAKPQFDIKTEKLLREILSVYGKFDAGYLEMLTHSEDPWLDARRGLDRVASSTNVIQLENMKRYYTKKLADSRAK